MYLSNINSKEDNLQKVQVCKKDNYKSVSLLAIYKAHFESEPCNHHDRFAVAVLQGEYAVGHLPRESSRVAWYFLRHGGEITCEISGRRRRSDDGKGLEVPCVYTFLGKPKMIKKVLKLLLVQETTNS